MRLFGPVNSGVAVGSTGTGDALSDTDSTHTLVGEIVGIYLRYNDSPPGSTVVVISTSGKVMPAQTLLTLTSANTDGWFRPAQLGCDDSGSPIVGAYLPTLIADNLNVSIDLADDGDSVDAWFILKGEDE